MRVWQASPDRWRVDAPSDAGEDDTYQVGDNTFTWDSGEQLLTGIFGQPAVRLPRAADLQPAALAVRVITEAGASAKVSMLPPQRVAGQSAAGLEIALTIPQSTIARADIWAVPASGLPLLVEVFGRGATRPALETRFLQVGPWTPDPAVLTPRRSPGTGFTTTTPSDLGGVLKHLDNELLPASLAGLGRQPSSVPQIGVYGSGLVCSMLQETKLVDYCWLANATGWPGYVDFEASKRWVLKQHLPTRKADCFGVEVDLNSGNAATVEFGQWRPKSF